MIDLSFVFLALFGQMNGCHFVWTVTVTTYPPVNAFASAGNWSMSCPGKESLPHIHNPNFTVLETSDCEDSTQQFPAHQGVIYGVCRDSKAFCNIHVVVPRNMYVRVYVRRLKYWCESRDWKTLIYATTSILGVGPIPDRDVTCSEHSLPEMYVGSNKRHMYIANINSPLVRIHIEAIKVHDFIDLYVTPSSGYVTVPTVRVDVVSLRQFHTEVRAPPRHSIMVSFQQSYEYGSCIQKIEVVYRVHNATHNTVLQVCDTNSVPAKALPTSCLSIHVDDSNVERGGCVRELKIHFSSLPANNEPETHHGVFNCSVDFYSQFQQHLHCNLKPECRDGRDETGHCPFSSPECRGLVASHHKCFLVAEVDKGFSLVLARTQCQIMGGRLASLKTRQEQNDFRSLFQDYGVFDLAVGFVSGWYLLPFTYSKFYKWLDGTVMYSMDHFIVVESYYPSRVVRTMALRSMRFVRMAKYQKYTANLIACEIEYHSQGGTLVKNAYFNFSSDRSFVEQTRQSRVGCSDGHMTQPCFVCDANNYCVSRKNDYLQHCLFFDVGTRENNTLRSQVRRTSNSNAMFRCGDGMTTIHYTMVCDFRQDCPEQSDESFCEHPSCHGFLCSDGHCVFRSQHCNEYSDCLDDSDEDCLDDSDEVDRPTNEPYYILESQDNNSRPVLVSFDGTGFFTRETMARGTDCPDGHYRCTQNSLHCLPIYTRCNEVPDCTYAEDELDCDRFTCPGFYRCRGSKVCVHGDHLCDGWGQCPQRDDELMCDRKCAEGCLCQGHSVLCHVPFTADLFQQLRYVDATGTGMTLSDFKTNWYLVHLTLSHCMLRNISSAKLPNLRVLHLASNHLETFDISVILELHNLDILSLANNPFIQWMGKSLKYVHYELKRTDVSRTRFQILNTELSIFLPEMEFFNLSSSGIETIRARRLIITPKLTELDIRQNVIRVFPVDLLSKWNHLKLVFTTNYRLCCDSLLPETSHKLRCLTLQPVFRSCQNLMPANVHVIYFGLLCALSIWGNLICIIGPFSAQKMFGNTLRTFSINLQFANICMGIHVNIVLIADQVFDGNYIHFEKAWTTSVSCKLAGFLSMLSTQVSIFIFIFITLDPFINVCFPGGFWTLDKRTTMSSCLIAWLTGVLLSSMPFLPGKSDWGVDDQSGLCHLAPSHNLCQEFQWFTVITTLNFLVSTLLVITLIVIYSRIPKYLITVDPSKRSMYSSVQLLVKVVATDAACWFSFAVALVMSFYDKSVAGRMHEALVAFVLPVNAALNPLLYMWVFSQMKRQQAKGERLLEVLQSRLRTRAKHQTVDTEVN